ATAAGNRARSAARAPQTSAAPPVPPPHSLRGKLQDARQAEQDKQRGERNDEAAERNRAQRPGRREPAHVGGDPEEGIVEVTDRDRAGTGRGSSDGAAGRAVEAERGQQRLDHAGGGEYRGERVALHGLDDRRGEEGHEQAVARIEYVFSEKFGHA